MYWGKDTYRRREQRAQESNDVKSCCKLASSTERQISKQNMKSLLVKLYVVPSTYLRNVVNEWIILIFRTVLCTFGALLVLQDF